jgi:hypothetical protein
VCVFGDSRPGAGPPYMEFTLVPECYFAPAFPPRLSRRSGRKESPGRPESMLPADVSTHAQFPGSSYDTSPIVQSSYQTEETRCVVKTGVEKTSQKRAKKKSVYPQNLSLMRTGQDHTERQRYSFVHPREIFNERNADVWHVPRRT